MAQQAINVPPGYSDYAAELEDLQRREKYAELLRAQSMKPAQSAGMAGRTVAPISWAQGAAQMLQSGAAGLGEQQTMEGRKALSARYQSDLVKAMKEGTPEAFMRHPALIGLGSNMLMANKLAEALRGPQASQQQEAPQQGRLAGYEVSPPQGMPQQGAPQQGGNMNPFGIPAQAFPIANMVGGGKELLDAMIKERSPHAVAEGGSLVSGAGQQLFARPKLGEGIQPTGMGPGGQVQGVASIPGYLEAQAAQSRAQASGPANFRTENVPVGGGATEPVLASDLPRVLGQGGGPPPQASNYSVQQGTPWQSPQSVNLQGVSPQQIRDAIASPDTPQEVKSYLQNLVGGSAPQRRTQTSQEEAYAKKMGAERAEIEADPAKALGHAKSVMEMSHNTLRTVDNLINNEAGIRGITGAVYGRTPSVTAPSMKAQNDYDALQAQLSVQSLQVMRDASKTGGAVGQVTEREWPKLASQIAGLSRAQNDADFKARLVEIRESLQRIQDVTKSTYEGNYGSLNWDAPKLPSERKVEEARKPQAQGGWRVIR